MTDECPVITVDGPSGTGKGTVSMIIANKLGWHYLDSGALYRVVALASIQQKVSPHDTDALVDLIHEFDVQFAMNESGMEKKVILSGNDVTKLIRNEKISQISSIISSIAEVRAALIERQKSFAQSPGLVTDGRDMGTVIFPKAPLKIYMTASAEIRAKRRLNQLKMAGIDANLAATLSELNERDKRDRARKVAPLKAAADAIEIDTSMLSIDEVVAQIFQRIISHHLISD